MLICYVHRRHASKPNLHSLVDILGADSLGRLSAGAYEPLPGQVKVALVLGLLFLGLTQLPDLLSRHRQGDDQLSVVHHEPRLLR